MRTNCCHLILITVFTLAGTGLHGQDQQQSIETLEETLNETFGVDKLRALNRLTEYYSQQRLKKAVRFGKQAVTLGENLYRQSGSQANHEEISLLVTAYNQLAQSQYVRGTYFESRRHFKKAIDLGDDYDSLVGLHIAEEHLSRIDSMVADGTIKQNFLSKTFGNLGIGEALISAATKATIETEILQGQSKEKRGDLKGAIIHYTTAVNQLKNTGNVERISSINLKIVALHDSLGQYQEAQDVLEDAIAEIVEMEVDLPGGFSFDTIAIEPFFEEEDPAATYPIDLEEEKKNLKAIADELASAHDEKSVAYYQLYQDLSQRMYEDSLQSVIEKEGRDREINLLSQQKQIVVLKLEAANAAKMKQIRLRNNLIFLSVLILMVCITMIYFYVSKRKEHGKLVKAYDQLDHAKTKLETAEQRIVTLLAQQVSGEVANELLANESNHIGERRFVCIMFLDIRDFTAMAETMSPEELIIYQNNVFSLMIDTIQNHHGTINQLLGDGFMATFGAPLSHGNDCQNAFNAAKEMLRVVREHVETGDIPPTRVGIGLHAGYVVTGNVGSEKRKQYSITGNAVIIASRVEQLNKEYKSQLIITEDVYNQLEKPLKLNQPFLEVTVKGRTQPVKILKIA